jgi:hypothetical protein
VRHKPTLLSVTNDYSSGTSDILRSAVFDKLSEYKFLNKDSAPQKNSSSIFLFTRLNTVAYFVNYLLVRNFQILLTSLIFSKLQLFSYGTIE